jgi:dipeptidyl aminopeptidase/acylaminoacyl peptidase
MNGSRRLNSVPRPRRLAPIVIILSLAGLVVLSAQTGDQAAAQTQTATPSQAAPATAAKTLTPEMCLNRWTIGDLRLSPDEARLALVISEPYRTSGPRRHIWIFDFRTGMLEPFTTSLKTDTQPRWSPDGKMLAFISNRDDRNQVYVIPIGGGEARLLIESKTGISSFEWSPDGRRIAFETTAPRTEEEEKKEKDKDDARVAGQPAERPLLQVMEVESKAVRTLVQGAWRIGEYAWTPDGSALIARATDNPQRELFSDKIYRVETADGAMTLLGRPAGPFHTLRVSPDGRTLAYIGSRGDGPEAHDLVIQPLGGGPVSDLTGRSIDRPVEFFVWEDNDRLFLRCQTGFGSTFYTVGRDGQAARSPWTPDLNVGTFAKGRTHLACVADSAVEISELWTADAPGAWEKKSRFNKDWDGLKLVKPEIVRYASFDRKPIEAALLRPEGVPAGAKPPAVILIHGGPTGAWTDHFQSWGQLLVARGFAVLYPNIRGSTGYGQEFMTVNRRDWGGGDFKDVMAGLDWLVARGFADPDRIGIGGWSYGGYMAAWAVTQTTRFKASVSGAPMTDLVMEYGTEDAGINADDTWALGTPYENLPLFLERSPLTHLAKVKTPILILCGENDVTDPVGQCFEFDRGLRRFGAKSELVIYPREGHGIREEKHQLDVLNRLVGWFETYLK